MPEKKTCLGTSALADAAVACGVEVCACYPITPTTGLTAGLAKHYANGKIPKYITVESEHSAMSALIGASAAGARTFTTTSSQGLLLMHEAIFCAGGMRLPIVMVVGNRAVSAPLNIWNDQQDTVSQRDAGWIQLYAESNQEAVDLLPQAFKIAEKTMLPAMVCVDGFILTHSMETIEIPAKAEVEKFLPPFNPEIKLDTQNPLSLGVYAAPPHYQDFREDVVADFEKAIPTIAEVMAEYGKTTGRPCGLVEEYRTQDADYILAGMGSVMGNAKAAADELRKEGEKVGVLKITCLRPFPREAIRKALSARLVGVIDRAVSPGGGAPLYLEAVEALSGDSGATVSSFCGGLGGREIGVDECKKMFSRLKERKPLKEWVARECKSTTCTK